MALNQTQLNTKLSPNFTLREFVATKHNYVDNTPRAEHLAGLTLLCERILEPVRAHFKAPVIITSGYRSPALNKLINGSPTSQHSKGEAADFHVKGVANQEVWKWIVDNLDYDQIIAEKLSKKDGQAGWIHVSYSSSRARNEALSYVGGKYLHGLHFIDE